MDIKDIFKIMSKVDKKKVKKFGIAGLIIALLLGIVFIIIAVMIFLFILNLLGDVFNLGALGDWARDTINSFIPGLIR